MLFEDGITIRGELARTIKEKAKAANKEPAELLREWINKLSSMEDLGDIKAADISEKNSKGKPNISGDDLFKQCGI